MNRHLKVNIAVGVIGSVIFTVSALVTAGRHDTVVVVLLAIFANIWIGRTIHLIRRTRNDAQHTHEPNGM